MVLVRFRSSCSARRCSRPLGRRCTLSKIETILHSVGKVHEERRSPHPWRVEAQRHGTLAHASQRSTRCESREPCSCSTWKLACCGVVREDDGRGRLPRKE